MATEITFAEFDTISGPDITVSYSLVASVPTNTITESASVNFEYLNMTPPFGLSGTLPATLVINASTTAPDGEVTSDSHGNLSQYDYAGNFSIVLRIPYGGYPAGYLLLSGNFGPIESELNGRVSSLTFSDSTPPVGEVEFSSNALQFGNGDEGLSLNLTGINNTAINAEGMFSGFSASDTGGFSANVIPEPFSFLLLGSGLVGLGLLRRKLR
jgi:hypothetical protein